MTHARKRFKAALPAMRAAARALGYALTTHGSMARDFDIVLVPWTDEAVSAEEVSEAVKAAAGGADDWTIPLGKNSKPHGRLSCCFDWLEREIPNGDYVDMSIMPRTA